MTVRLRPHHLLCLLTYLGEGYSPAFVANYDRIAERLSGGEGALVVAGPDDICAPIADASASHCESDSVAGRDRRAALDVGAVLGTTIMEGTALRLDGDTLVRLRMAFSKGLLRSACGGCEWSELCSAVAAGGFRRVKVREGLRRRPGRNAIEPVTTHDCANPDHWTR